MEDRDVEVLERILAGSEEPKHLPLGVFKTITGGFSDHRKIGAGGFGVVYRGDLGNGGSVAVKRIFLNINTVDDSKFNREVTSLLQVNHPNVVRFLGFCSSTDVEKVIDKKGSQPFILAERRERLLCFEYISNGNLDKFITDGLRGLEWNTRYEIIRGICNGLQYLHRVLHIIHMDLKPANIMIDSGMVPKITDFGLSRTDEKSCTTGTRFGTWIYCAPEYSKNGITTYKCDMYSLGVIVTALVTGHTSIQDINNVIRRWRHRWNKLPTLTPLQDQQVNECQVIKCIEIAKRCMENEPKGRPSISDVICIFDEIGNMNCRASSQIYPRLDDDDMLGIEPLELRFAFEPNQEISCEVELTNGTGNCIAFDIEMPSMYRPQPNKGIVQPQSKCTVEITLQAQETTSGEHHPDEFIVRSMKVEDSLKDEDVTLSMFMLNNEAAGKVVDEVNFTVVYIKKVQVEQSLEFLTEPNAPTSKGINSRRSQDTKRLNFRPPHQIASAANVSYRYKTSDRAVDLMTGAMGSLLPKLRLLLKQEHHNLQNVKKDVESLMEQLTDMHTALSNLSQEQLDQLDPQDKRWANKVRELSYDTEDSIDNLLAHTEHSEPITKKDGIRGLMQKMFNLIKWSGTPYNISHVIQDIKTRVKEVADGRAEFKLGNFSTNQVTSTCDRLLALYSKNLFGIDGPRDELVDKLIGGDDGVSKQQLKVISIFGDGGLGKTTLAKSVYDKLQEKFGRTAFVSVGRNPDMKEVLEDILLELDRNKYADIHNKRWNEKNLIDELHNVLKNKRYLIVIDDIWDIASWEKIKYALIDDGCGSRVITTSRKFRVAERNGEFCKLGPLSNDDSKKLFNAILLSRKGTRTLGPPDEQSTKYILLKCGGVPLAIITIASLLAGKNEKDWPKVYNSIGFGHEDNTDVDNTRKILLFSYYDLPWHLKTCLLYVSIFPEYREIEKDTLVWRWVTEGFVHEEPGNTLFKVGEGYFYELIDRSLIQPVVEQKTCNIYACRVHDMVLDMICSTAQEENFVTILGVDEQHLSSQSNARIVAVQKRSILEQDGLASTCNPKVRSFNGTGCSIGITMPLLQSFQVLRVFSLEGCTLTGDAYNLKNIAGLLLLRYLGLNGTHLLELPTEIGDLRSLQTLDLRGTQIEALPHSVTLLRQLKCLRFDATRPLKFLPAGMGNLTSLEDLHLYLPVDSLSFGEELGKLTELRVLRIYTHVFFGRSWNETFVESLSNLQKIEELELCGGGIVNELKWGSFSPSGQLRDLRLQIYSQGLPAWINSSLLSNLTHLDIDVRSMKATDVDILGGLPELLSLVVSISEKPFFHAVTSDGAFPKLRCCYMRKLLLTCQLGAMPCLESVKFDVPMRALKDANFDLKEFDSLSFLPLLGQVHVYIWCDEAMREEVEEVEAAVRHVVGNHCNCPILVLDRMGYCKDERVRSRLLKILLPTSKHLDHTDQSNDDERQQGAGEQEGSGPPQVQATERKSNQQRQ